jgi:hypothetical protein
MSGGRLGSLLTIAWVGLATAMPGCGGDAFSTAGAESGSSTGPDASAASGDAQSDAASSPDAAAPDAGAGWCATQATTHTFCEDFLRGVPDKLVGLTSNAMLLPDMADYESAPQSMAAVTLSLPLKGDSATALATHAFSGATGTQFTLAAYFKVASSCFPANGGFDPVTVAALGFFDQGYEVAIAATPSGVELIEIMTGPDGGVTATPQFTTFDATGLLDSWKPWTVTINGGLVKSITLTVGGTPVIPSRTLKSATLTLQHPTLFLGATVRNDQGISPGCRVNVDDILFDAKAAATPAN